MFLIRGEGLTGWEQPQGRKVTLAGPKSHIGRAEKSHWRVQKVTLECYIICIYIYIYIPRHVMIYARVLPNEYPCDKARRLTE